VPHRLRVRDPGGLRGRPGRGHEHLDGPHGLHGRPAGAGGRRPGRRREGRADPPKRDMAAARVNAAGTSRAEKTREERYAELAVRVGANVQPGQLVDVVARVEHAAVARAVARAAYQAGAAYVDVYYSDQHIRRALIEHVADDLLSWTPP